MFASVFGKTTEKPMVSFIMFPMKLPKMVFGSMISQLFRPKKLPHLVPTSGNPPSGRGAGGSYKLCYQAPGGSDSVEQKPAAGAIALKVEQVPGEGCGTQNP